MQNKPLTYIRLQAGDPLPSLAALALFKAILIIDDEVSQMWQWEASRWIAGSNCRYMMAWGPECGAWKESVEDANAEAFNYDEIPLSDFIETTSHEDEELSDVFWFSRHSARHPCHELRDTVILHISGEDKQRQFEAEYLNA